MSIRAIKTGTYYVYFFMKGSNHYSHKLRYERYIKLICMYLSDDMYINLIRKKIPFGELTNVYGNVHVIVM